MTSPFVVVASSPDVTGCRGARGCAVSRPSRGFTGRSPTGVLGVARTPRRCYVRAASCAGEVSRQATGPPAGPWRTHGFVVPSVRGEGRRRRPRRGRARRDDPGGRVRGRAHRALLLGVRRGVEQQQGPRDLQRHRRGRSTWRPAATTSRCSSTAPRVRRAHDQPHRVRRGRRRLRAGPERRERRDPRAGRPDQRLRLVQRRRRRRAAQGHARSSTSSARSGSTRAPSGAPA